MASLAVLALLALTMIEATQGSTRAVRAELDRARLTAAADAGIELAVQGLAQPAAARRWRPDGSVRSVTFAEATLEIRITDELGKVPLNQINAVQIEALLAEFGLAGTELEAARDALLDWRDSDELPRPRGAERDDYANDGVEPRDGPLRSNGELAAIPAIGPQLARRMDPFVTVFAPNGAPFTPATASPLARRVMAQRAVEEPTGGVTPIEGGLEGLEGLGPPRNDDGVIGRPLRIEVRASLPGGSAARRNLVVELTGNRARPYVVRARE